MDVVTTVEARGVEEVFAKLDVIFARVREAWKDAADLLARLTGPQMQEVKRRYKGIISADHLDRLAMLGAGKLSPHLALPERTIPASLLKRLPDLTLAALNDPDREAEVWHRDGKVVLRRMGEMNQLELGQVVNDETGEIRTADQQRRAFLAMAKRPIENLKADSLVFEGLTLNDGTAEAFVYLRDPADEPGTKRYTVTIPVKTLRSLLR